jgi:hypothetical protein
VSPSQTIHCNFEYETKILTDDLHEDQCALLKSNSVIAIDFKGNGFRGYEIGKTSQVFGTRGFCNDSDEL